jgi:hypothetical protein
MSDMSVLSHEYKTASELSQHISTALILLKKVYYHLPGEEAVTPEELDRHRHALATILTTLVGLLTVPRPQQATSALSVSIPETLVMRLQAERRGDLIYYLDDLAGVAERLREQPLQLDEGDLALLDQLATVADAEASSVYRRLMRI